jgi:hypothetical protein
VVIMGDATSAGIHIALHIEQGAARVAAIDAGIGLDISIIGAAACVAEHGRDNPASYRST